MTTSLYASLGVLVSRDPNPGTIRTATVETIDNDHGFHELMHSAVAEIRDPDSQIRLETPDPPPSEPGTTVTFTSETTDEAGNSGVLLLS